MGAAPVTAAHFEQLAEAGDLDEVLICLHSMARAYPSGLKDTETIDLKERLLRALHAHLFRQGSHARFRYWVDTYFGRKPVSYQSRYQQPNYIYYPGLPPKPWFSSQDVPALLRLRAGMAPVAAEIAAFVESDPDFAPYVPPEAARQRIWKPLAGSKAWSSIHLIKAGARREAVLERLPVTDDFVAQLPLARCPPHAPECFISQLLPGAMLPPHYGLSNFKLTAHLPVHIPPDRCRIVVAGESRSWPGDDFLIFDDSFLHSAENSSPDRRTVLIFDIWHPSLDPEERSSLSHAIAVLDEVRRHLGHWLA